MILSTEAEKKISSSNFRHIIPRRKERNEETNRETRSELNNSHCGSELCEIYNVEKCGKTFTE